MGLNLETLIGILVVLILLILGDGIRRMIRERGKRLRLRIDPRVRDLPDEPEPRRNTELVSGPRVVRKNQGSAPSVADFAEADQGAGAADEVPPLVMEKEERGAEPISAEAQRDLFERDTAPATERSELLEVIVIHLVTAAPVDGRELLQQLLEQGLRFGEMNIFHRYSQGGSNDELLFSMANALEPGTFDIDEMEDQRFRAVTFFMKLPGPRRPMDALDRMLATARKLAEGLEAELRDEQHSVLTPQTTEHLRQRVQDFERRRLTNAQ